MVNRIKRSRQVQEAETGNMLTRDGTDEVVVESQKCGFGGVEFTVSRLKIC